MEKRISRSQRKIKRKKIIAGSIAIILVLLMILGVLAPLLYAIH